MENIFITFDLSTALNNLLTHKGGGKRKTFTHKGSLLETQMDVALTINVD